MAPENQVVLGWFIMCAGAPAFTFALIGLLIIAFGGVGPAGEVAALLLAGLALMAEGWLIAELGFE